MYSRFIVNLIQRKAFFFFFTKPQRYGVDLYQLYLTGTYSKFLPYILMGSITVGSAVVNVFLPETLNKQLPETVEEMQECQG